MAELVQIKKNAVILHHPNVAEICRDKGMGRHDASVGLYKGFVEHLRIDRFYRQALKTEHAKGVRHYRCAADGLRRGIGR